MNAFSTADIYDHYAEQVKILPSLFRHFGGHHQFSGIIQTIKCFEDNSLVREKLSESGVNKVLLVDGGKSYRCALLGDNIAQLAIENHWSGIIIYGCIRDSRTIAQMPIGVCALGTNPRKSVKRGEGQMNITLELENIKISPNHYIYCDEDGIILSENPLNLNFEK